MKNNIRHIITGILFCFYFGSGNSFAQIDTSFSKNDLNYNAYSILVWKNNLSYAAEKFNLSIAAANVEAAKVFPDPELTFGGFDNGQQRMKMGYGFGSQLGWTIELGGKRKARIDLANSEYELSALVLQGYFRNLRADATLAYLLALKQKLVLTAKLNSYTSMKELASADSIRFKLGAITEVDARQSKLEAGTILNDVYQSEADWKNILLKLGILLGKQNTDTLYNPSGDFSKFERAFNLNELIITAQNNRTDLLAAFSNKIVSQNLLKLTQANRVTDLGVAVGLNNTSVVTNIVAPTPSFINFSGGITIPLKFSNNNRGQLKMAEYGTLQADATYRQTELQIQTEVAQAYYNYLAAKKQVLQFNTGLLNDSKKVLEGKIYSYQRGETALLEVLNAQRTYNETQQSYYETLYNHAAALIELERAVGIWDINF